MINLEFFPEPEVLPLDVCSNFEIVDCCGRVTVAPVLEGLVNDGADEEILRQAISMLVFHSVLSREIEGSLTLNNRRKILNRQSFLFNKVVRMEGGQQEWFDQHYYVMTGINYPVVRMEILLEQWGQIKDSIPEHLM